GRANRARAPACRINRSDAPRRESGGLSQAAAHIALRPASWHDASPNQARWSPMPNERMTVNGIELEVLRRGAGTPLLLLHGMDTVPPQARFLDRLGRDAEIIAPSSPGFGNTKRPTDFDTVYDLVHLYLALLGELPYEKVALLGLSFGGWLAAEVAVACRHRVSKLILVDPVGIKLGGPTTRDILDVFNVNPAELRRCSWHDPAKAPGCPGRGRRRGRAGRARPARQGGASPDRRQAGRGRRRHRQQWRAAARGVLPLCPPPHERLRQRLEALAARRCRALPALEAANGGAAGYARSGVKHGPAKGGRRSALYR